MKRNFFAITLLFLCLTGAGFAQDNTVEKQYEFRGIVKNKDSAVFTGLPLFFSNNGKESVVSTDINGEFSIKLLPVNYKVSVRKTISETFKAFINIQENGLNPNDVEFIIETNPICCEISSEKPYPKIIKLPKPPYPAAASAVRAMGEVVVGVKIDKEGKVISAAVESGHPLLKAASVQAARQILFEKSESDEQREAKLTFVFLPFQKEKENIKRYSYHYRIIIVAPNPEINY